MSKKFIINPTAQQIDVMKKYWKRLKEAEDTFFQSVSEIEGDMCFEVGITDLEFFQSDFGEYCGIGNASRTMNLIHETDLIKREELN